MDCILSLRMYIEAIKLTAIDANNCQSTDALTTESIYMVIVSIWQEVFDLRDLIYEWDILNYGLINIDISEAIISKYDENEEVRNFKGFRN